jgi:hypothetical protein
VKATEADEFAPAEFEAKSLMLCVPSLKVEEFQRYVDPEIGWTCFPSIESVTFEMRDPCTLYVMFTRPLTTAPRGGFPMKT